MAGLLGDQQTGLLGDQDYTPVLQMSPESLVVNSTISSATMSSAMEPESLVVNTKVTNSTMYAEGTIFKSNNIVVF